MRAGFELPILFAAAFRSSIDALHEELAERGHPDVRPVHGFALQAIGADGVSTSGLGHRLGVSKQAAAKTAAGLVDLGYVTRTDGAGDGRVRLLRLTPRGVDCLAASAEAFDRQRAAWVDRLGADRVAALEDDLEALVGTDGAATPGVSSIAGLPGWLR